MASVYPDQGAGSSYGSTPTTYGFDAQYTVTQQAQPPPYPVTSYNTQLGPKPAWDYPQHGAPITTVPYSQPQQARQQVVIIGGATTAPIRYTAVESYAGQLVVSCLVFWFCNFLFGFIAFVLAAVASNVAVSDSEHARRLGRASYILSGTGILVTIVTIAIIVGVFVGGTAAAVSGSGSCAYYKNGGCYRYRSSSYSSSWCSYYFTSYYYNYSDGYCYYNY